MEGPVCTPLRELAGLFLRLGFTAFGGPVAHVALIEEQVVNRRGWLDRQHFLDTVSAVNFIPGPNSTELVIHIGQLRAGLAGLIVAGVCFIVPAMLLILPLAWAYVKWGSLPQIQPAMQGIYAAIAAIIAFATIRFAQSTLKAPFPIVVAIMAIALYPLVKQFVQPEIPLLILAALAGVIVAKAKKSPATTLAVALPIGFIPQLLQLCWEMLKIGGTLFGSGYVLISYLQSSMIDAHGWMTQKQLADAIAVGQFTPGPLLTTATFVGYLLGSTTFGGGTIGGIVGGIAATTAIFLPSFLFVAIFGSTLQRLRTNELARAALDGMNAAVVGVMVITAIQFTWPVLMPNQQFSLMGILLFVAALAGLWNTINATWIIIVCGLIGALVSTFFS